MGKYSCLLWVLLFVEGISSDDEIIRVAKTEGDSFTLEGFPVVQRNEQIVWKFKEDIIFKVEEAAGINLLSKDDRLKLDKQTGSLTITNSKSIHGGTYQLEISGNEDFKRKRFSVTVHDVKKEFSFTKIQINQTGTYDVEINTTNLIVHRKFKVTVAKSGAPSGICGAGVGLVVWAVTVFLLQEV